MGADCQFEAKMMSDEAKAFYLKLGLELTPLEPMTLMATVGDLRATMGS
jgi:hypothetical protein